MDEAQRNECSFERLVMRLMDEAGLCAYGEDTGSYNVPVPAMLSRIGRIVEAAMQLGRDECISEAERLRAEVESANGWNERVSVCRDHVADIVDGPCVICALDAAEARAERLAEALRPHIEDLEQSAVVLDQYPAMAPTAAEMRKAAAELRAALEQESNDA